MFRSIAFILLLLVATAAEAATIQVTMVDGLSSTTPLSGVKVVALEVLPNGKLRRIKRLTTNNQGRIDLDLPDLENGKQYRLRTKVFGALFYSPVIEDPHDFTWPVGNLAITLKDRDSNTPLSKRKLILFEKHADGSLTRITRGKTNRQGVARLDAPGIDNGKVFMAMVRNPFGQKKRLFSKPIVSSGAVTFAISRTDSGGLDNQAPELALLSPTDGDTVPDTGFQMEGQATDKKGQISRIRVTVNDPAAGEHQYETTTDDQGHWQIDIPGEAVSAGQTIGIDIHAYDDSYNLQTLTLSLQVMADNRPTSPATLQLDTQTVLDFDHKLPNRIQNGSFELGIGAEPIYFGWKLEEATGDLTPPALPVIDTTTAMEGSASVKIAKIKRNHHVHIDFTPPDISDEYDGSGSFQGYIYTDLKTDCPGKLYVHFPMHDQWPTTEWKRYKDMWGKTSHTEYDWQSRRIYIYNTSDQECTLWMDGLTWTVDDVGQDQWLRYAPVEAVFLPSRHDGIHFAGKDVVLHYKMNTASDVTRVVAELHLRDLSRGGVDLSVDNANAQYIETLTLNNGDVVDKTINLGHLKRGAYMAHLAFYDPDTKEILGVARERFTVMDDLRNKPAPIDFVVGTHGGLLTFADLHEFSMRGSWSADDFYKTSYITGLRAQRLLPALGTFMPENGVYDLNLVKGAIDAAHDNNCTTILNIDPFRIKNKNSAAPTGGPGDWVFQDGRDLTNHLGPNSPYNLHALPVDRMQTLYGKVASEFGDKLLALENVNELNMYYAPEKMGDAVADLFEPVYDIVKSNAPNLPVLANFTMDFYGLDFTTNFMGAGGVDHTDGFTYHPYGRTFAYYRNNNGNEQPGISFVKQNEGFRDRYKDTKSLVTGMSEIHGIASKSAVGWDVMQRVLLDWSGGAKFSAGLLPGGLYFLETGNAGAWADTYSKAPGVALVAVNAMNSILGGYELLKRVDWNDDNNHGVLIVIFKKPGKEAYTAALLQGDFPDKRAVLNVTLPSDAVFYDQWGEQIEPTNPLKLSNEVIYIKTTDSSIISLFDDESVITWSSEPNGYDYELELDDFQTDPSDAWFKTLLKTGIPPRTPRQGSTSGSGNGGGNSSGGGNGNGGGNSSGGGSGNGSGGGNGGSEGGYAHIPAGNDLTDRMALRFLNMTTFGSTPEAIAELRQKGVVNWVEEQLNKPWDQKENSVLYHTVRTVLESGPYQYLGLQKNFPYDQIEAKTQAFIADNDTVFNQNRVNLDVIDHYSSALFGRQLEDSAQLRQRVAYALSQIIVAGESRERPFSMRGEAIAYYYDLLLKNAFGNYGDLLYEVSLSPAMGRYLTYANNRKSHLNDNGFTITPDENYGREIMQLFSIGPFELGLDGSPVMQGREKIPTYDQEDVNEMAKVFTGLHYSHSRFGDEMVKADMIHPMTCEQSQHEPGPKTVLGHTIPGGTCEEDIADAIDILMQHTNTAPFVATKLIKRLTKSNPGEAYIERVATIFQQSGGNLGETVEAILLDPEIWDDIKNDRVVKLKEPYVAFLNFLKAFDVQPLKYFLNKGTNRKVHDSYRIVARPEVFGQWPTWAPTVFNFYNESFVPNDSAFRSSRTTAPEASIMTTRYLVSTANFIKNVLVYNEWSQWLYREGYDEDKLYNHWDGITWWDPFLRIDFDDQLAIYRQALGGSLDGYASDGAARKTQYTGALETLISDLEQRLVGKQLEPDFRQSLLDAFQDDWVGVGGYSERDLAAVISNHIGKIVAQIVRSEEFMTN